MLRKKTSGLREAPSHHLFLVKLSRRLLTGAHFCVGQVSPSVDWLPLRPLLVQA